jgi:hypothetical protein
MSKLSDQFTTQVQDFYRVPRTKPTLSNFSAKTVIDGSSHEYYRQRQVKVIAKFEYTGWINETKTPGDENQNYSAFLNTVRRQVIEEVFGEFRPFIYEMNTALYDEDLTRIRTLLANLEQQMFTV